MTTHKPQIILASGSPRREQLLREMGLHFTVVLPDAVEEVLTGAAPDVLATQNARRKARAVAGRHPRSLIIGADTVVVLDGKTFGKPRDPADAGRMLGQLVGRQHEVITGVCLIHWRTHRRRLFVAGTDVTFRALDAAAIDRYLQHVHPIDKAGAYAIQEHGELIVHEISGSFSNVVGLPVEQLQVELSAFRVPA